MSESIDLTSLSMDELAAFCARAKEQALRGALATITEQETDGLPEKIEALRVAMRSIFSPAAATVGPALVVPLEREEAWALGLLLKRLSWSAVRECAQDDAEARIMLIAIERTQSALEVIGVRPR